MSYFSRVLGTEYSNPIKKIPTKKTMKGSNSHTAMHAANATSYSTLSHPINCIPDEQSTSALLAMQIPRGSQYTHPNQVSDNHY